MGMKKFKVIVNRVFESGEKSSSLEKEFDAVVGAVDVVIGACFKLLVDSVGDGEICFSLVNDILNYNQKFCLKAGESKEIVEHFSNNTIVLTIDFGGANGI